ncbi:hypothetical protein [Actinomadura welshii]|uniref:hypothetical protein n=1 Tax=Actinomadura welshii TaxID=3103817 RepID=UPI0012679D11|nr:hypothetical protein [Actinomadura madurae]
MRLVSRLFSEELRRFPVLTAGAGGRTVEQEDLLQEFLADRFKALTAALLAQASDEGSMGRLVRKSIKNWLIDQARKTGTGPLRRSLEGLLAQDAIFEKVPPGAEGAGRWRLAGSAGPPYSGHTGDLVDAARAVPNVRIPPWSSSKRRAPAADKASMVAVARAVLEAASGSLEIAQIVEVFVARFPAVLDPVVVPLLESEIGDGFYQPTPEEAVVAADDEVDHATNAAGIVGTLSAAEQQILRCLTDPQAVERLLGCGRSQAYHHIKRLREKLKQLAGEDDAARAVVLEVIQLCGGIPEDQA